jgi:hypothetical protein
VYAGYATMPADRNIVNSPSLRACNFVLLPMMNI